MKDDIKLCMGCMNEKAYSGPCEVCGYIENTAYLPQFLAPHTVLSDRYIVGKVLSYNGEGAVYIAYDTEENKTVDIREYLPDALCTRKKDTENVVVNDGCLPLYKSYLSEFADLYKALMNNNESESIRKVLGIFAANNTGYVVLEHLSGCSLAEFLEKNGGTLSWQAGKNDAPPSVKELFPPLLTALNMLHSHGIIHRGLSPESIYIDEKNRLKLTAFGTSASRTEGSSINCELFGGYAAPEQYEVSERQGTWTDIYGICAVMYRALTGTQPQEANSRELNDVLEQPYFINPAVPHGVSDTIMAGMCMRQDERIHTVNDLVQRMFTSQEPSRTEDEDDGPITPAVARVNQPSRAPQSSGKTPPRRRPPAKSKKKKQSERSSIGTIIGVSVFLAIVVGFIIAIVYFSQASQELLAQQTTTPVQTFSPVTTEAPRTEETTTSRTSQTTAAPPASGSSAERILLPNFVNRFYNLIENNYPMLKFNPVYEYNNDYANGIVFEQDIDPETEVTGGTEITVKVSKGKQTVPLPDYTGKKLEKYTKELGELGIKYDVEEEETSEVKAGYVSRCSKEIDEEIMISDDEKVIVYVAKKPKKTKATQTEPPETEAPEIIETEDEGGFLVGW